MSGAVFQAQPKGFATKAIHIGQDPDQWDSRCVVPPIVMASTFKQDVPGEVKGFLYGRLGNPTRAILEECLASLDNGKHALTYASGIGAVANIFSLLNVGDHIICSEDIYGGTNVLLKDASARCGIEYDFIDAGDIGAMKAGIKKNTRMIWLESPTNPILKVVDIKALSEMAHQQPNSNIIVVVDNTFLSAYFQRPLELGADIVMYSLTKYSNGHSDVIMGASVTNSDELNSRLKTLQAVTGNIPSPFDCYQVNRSLKTLAIRMEQHQKNSLAVAKYLETHPSIEKVLHPALPSHPQHELALRQCYGHSGMVSFYIKGGLNESKIFLKSLKMISLAISLGGYESLAQLPYLMTHAAVPEDDRRRLGISPGLIRLSVGLEDPDDVCEDLNQALIKCKG